jgi:hypothetical protein
LTAKLKKKSRQFVESIVKERQPMRTKSYRLIKEIWNSSLLAKDKFASEKWVEVFEALISNDEEKLKKLEEIMEE